MNRELCSFDNVNDHSVSLVVNSNAHMVELINVSHGANFIQTRAATMDLNRRQVQRLVRSLQSWLDASK